MSSNLPQIFFASDDSGNIIHGNGVNTDPELEESQISNKIGGNETISSEYGTNPNSKISKYENESPHFGRNQPINSTFSTIMKWCAIILLCAGFFFLGSFYEKGFSSSLFSPEIETINQAKVSTQQKGLNFQVFWEAWDILHKDHINRDLDDTKLVQGAIKGVFEAVGDPYTNYLDPEASKELKENLGGSYAGIGAELGIKDSVIIVVSPLEGSPALAAGLKTNDKIIKIDSQDTARLNLQEAVKLIRGEKGTPVKLTIFREGENSTREITITRDEIIIDSVKWKDLGDGIGYIRLSRFGNRTVDEWADAVTNVSKISNLKSVILDVRSNPGGYLDVAVDLSAEFLPRNTLVTSQEESNGKKEDLTTKRPGRLEKFPVVVLLNEGSASASEIMAGALRERDSAKLVGKTSFGKGTVQEIRNLSDNSAAQVTIAKWLTPDGNWIHEKGIEPDFAIENTEESLKLEKDLQLEKATEVAKSL